MIYLDNAATTIDKDESVARAVYNAINSKSFGNPSRGAYKVSLDALDLLMQTRKKVGSYFGMDNPLNVVLCQNITFALNFVINSLFDKNDHIITSLSEHNSVLRPLYSLVKDGMEISFIDIKDDFSLDLEEIENLVKKNTKALIITGASNISGVLTDLDRTYEICKKNDLKLIIDGAQVAGYVPFDIKKYDNSIFLFTGHKGLHAPQGTGGFIVNGDFNFRQVFSGGSGFDSFSKTQPHILPDLFEPGTANVHSFSGLKAAVEFLEKSPHKNINELTKILYDGLKDIQGIKFYSNINLNHVPIISFNIKDIPANYIAMKLWDDYEICVRAGSHCAPLFHEKMGTKKQGIVRMSLSFYNTKEEIEKTIDAVKNIAKEKS
ncbi:aminotransferase class V-fold PLP-dependent enzyme [Anaerococcus ihuae]|uniref:aminotransferase class V-fold PLP-dependent enzyme n=1 Tax=Anaerococcus ihuae TaxID=2899519 RepID=UPI001F1E24B7|nr:aminotransferase class V-fold PLP-dependent enzyme [Anaerococcus ihuae]